MLRLEKKLPTPTGKFEDEELKLQADLSANTAGAMKGILEAMLKGEHGKADAIARG